MKEQLKTIREALLLRDMESCEGALAALTQLEAMVGERDPRTREQHLALREAHHHADSEAYFKARAELNTYGGRTAFEAGYQRGFDAAGTLYAASVDRQYEAGDMASAAAQGFRDGVASVTQQEPVACVGSYWADGKGFDLCDFSGDRPAPGAKLYAAPVAQPQAEAVPFNHATQLQIAYVKGLGDGAMQAEAVPPDVEVIRKALERAFIMGQNYWADADSESYSANKRSDVTRQKFNAMRDEVCAAIAQQKGGV